MRSAIIRYLRTVKLKRDETTGIWKKLHIEELHKFYSSPSMIIMIKSRRIKWAGHVARKGEKINACRILESQTERGHWEDQGVNGWTILNLISER
jgi:hypothetical protein